MQISKRGPESDVGLRNGLDACLTQQFTLCQMLETLADDLPSRVDSRGAMNLADRLEPTLRRCHRMEETIVFPVLLAAEPRTRLIVDRLRQEHIEDEDHACDVCDAITAFVTQQTPLNVDEIGYMLRCLFMSLRRHLAFDRDHVLPLYRRTCGF